MVVVDDSPDVRRVIAALLDEEGESFVVVGEAGDGKEGVSVVKREQPDLVLLDLAMPVMDGLEALPRILLVAPSTRVIVMSGFGTDAMVHAAMARGARAFIAKGADLATKLVATMKAVGGGEVSSD